MDQSNARVPGLAGAWVPCPSRTEICMADCPQCGFVFTIPKRLRIYFRFDRRLLGQLCRAAARTVITVYRAASGRPDAVPGMVGAIQTFGQLIHWHPHIHALVTEGVTSGRGNTPGSVWIRACAWRPTTRRVCGASSSTSSGVRSARPG